MPPKCFRRAGAGSSSSGANGSGFSATEGGAAGRYFGAGLSTNLGPKSIASTGYNDFDLHISVIAYQHNSMQVKIIGQAFDLFGTENNLTINTSPITNSFGAATSGSNTQIGELAAQFSF